MRICFMAHAASEHTKRFVAHFVDRGHDCHVLSFTPGEVPGARVQVFASARGTSKEGGNWQYLARLPQVAAALRSIRPDLVNAHFVTSYGFIAALAHHGRAPVVLRAGGSDVLTLPHRHAAYRLVARVALRRADAIITPAAHLSDAVRRWVGPRKPILTCQYGVDTRRFHPRTSGAPDPTACLCNRAWVHNSNIDTILRAMARLKQRGSPARLTLLGGGHLEADIRRQVRALHLEDRVTLVDRVPASRVPDFLHRHAVWISVTSSDGLPMSLAEAMACAAVPIVSDIAAYRDYVHDGRNGLVVPLGDDEALAASILRATGDARFRRRAAAHNWAFVQEHLDYWKNMDTIEDYFQRVVRDT